MFFNFFIKQKIVKSDNYKNVPGYYYLKRYQVTFILSKGEYKKGGETLIQIQLKAFGQP